MYFFILIFFYQLNMQLHIILSCINVYKFVYYLIYYEKKWSLNLTSFLVEDAWTTESDPQYA